MAAASRGIAAASVKLGRGIQGHGRGIQGHCRGISKTGPRHPHPVWPFKILKGRRWGVGGGWVGVRGAGGWPSIVFRVMPRKVCLLLCSFFSLISLSSPSPFSLLLSPSSLSKIQNQIWTEPGTHLLCCIDIPELCFFVKIDSCVDVLLPVKWSTSTTNWKRTDQYVSSGG